MSPILRSFLENERGIKRYLSRFLPRAHDVDDLAQETFLRAFAENGSHVNNPRAFLYRIARNLALNERDRMSYKITTSMEDFPDPAVLGAADQVSVEETVEGRRKMAILSEAVSALPPQCRQVFILRKIHGLSQKEVALRLGLSVSTVEKHLATGLVKCSEFLRLRGYEVGGGATIPEPRRKGQRYGSKGSSADV